MAYTALNGRAPRPDPAGRTCAARHFRTLSRAEQEKDVEAMNAMLMLLQIYDGVRIYRYREENDHD